MLSNQPVVAAIDFHDEDWKLTVDHAVHHARQRGVIAHLVHVLAPSPWLLRKVLDEASVTAHEQDVMDSARRRLDDVAEAARAEGVQVEVQVRRGKPSLEVLAAIKELGADLLVIGMGSSSASSLLIGGTADRLLRMSPVPLLVRGPRAPQDIRRVLVPTGLGPSGVFALRTAAAKVAGKEGAQITALHMIALPGVMRAYSGDVPKLRAALEAEAKKELDAHVAKAATAEMGAPTQALLRTNLETVPADQTILAEARDLQADLICLSLGGRAIASGPIIGRVSERLIRALPCPLLALPDAWIDRNR
jgi:nucleotide-binding universal stress UspA family protein